MWLRGWKAPERVFSGNACSLALRIAKSLVELPAANTR